MKMRLHEPILRMMLMLMTVLFDGGMAVKCLDCVGRDCMGTFCEGDYCVLGRYAPRWGTIEWGESRFVKGCMSGTMLETDIRSHCETVDDGTENGDSEVGGQCSYCLRSIR
ncbi:unnamed protein product [Anisakis simplex]|uniref:Secreted protein n=1 Tax=Anisakis simplex TaxID=6269 RepID=A0A0M3JB34_ANISI|nr:unnamed protein product [Anisakis simplex]